ncbi:PspC domain-containing protein [Candidatus Coxiella mudrowiae]|uniref:PspC domain-containing protein n=1 Tax=Candidatus Coxiella mudrowiae TaxID=2054173 RepID=UPI00352EB6AA
MKCLYRSCTNRKITGVCGGECFNVDRIIMRMVLYFIDILVILFSVSFVIIAYILMWIIVPEALEQSEGETMHWKDKQPIYKQLKEKIIEAIVDGSYPEGE